MSNQENEAIVRRWIELMNEGKLGTQKQLRIPRR